MTTATVVVIEDELQIRRFLRAALEGADMTVHEAADGRQGLIEVATRQPDLVIVDLGLPDQDGVVVIRELRGWSGVPVIVLSARTQEAEKVAALDAGADDYLTKPFGVSELLARMRAHLRRWQAGSAPAEAVVRLGAVTVDLASRQVSRDSEPIHLTPVEYRLLVALLRHAGKVLTHRQLLLEVWGPAASEHSHYLRIYMGHLRRKLEDNPAQPKYLLTESGVGYRLLV
jgi:two-component system KDP operon response regulator KdpE